MKMIGLILAGGNNVRMGKLSERRAIAAMPIAGSYRAIDFTLNSMSANHLSKVAILTQYNSRSLHEHLNSSKWWDFGRKQGGMYIFAPTTTMGNTSWYRGTADAIYQNVDFLKRCHEPYVVIAQGECVYKIDFNEVLNYHVNKHADITVVCKDMPAGEDLTRFGIVSVDIDNKIINFDEKPIVVKSNKISCGIYIIRRRLLIDLIEECNAEGRYDFVRDILVRYKDVKRIYAYNMDGYWSNINSLAAYYRTNMDFLRPEIRDYFFAQEPSLKSKIDDLPAAKYNVGVKVSNSMISGGCIINGTVENSILFKGVYIGNNVTVKNAIILNGSYIGDNSYIENCIVESRDTVKADSRYVGSADDIKIVMEKNQRFLI
ncbi:MAG: glucose-1-phosphate adenylyltransferase subunit GlgD [Eubacteriales bacterium]|nr:glucose-1-phosphate adenylyltransferase subunit GlgD [Eubacteriales bacterium]